MLRLSAILSCLVWSLSVCSVSLAQSPTDFDVTIVSSKLNQTELEKKDQDYLRGVEFWKSVADRAGLRYRVAGDYELDNDAGNQAVYVFHMVERLSDAGRANIEKLVERGASLIIVGMLGRYDPWGGEVSSLPARWLEMEGVQDYTPTEYAYFAARGGSLAATAAPPGYRFEYEYGYPATLCRTRWAQAYHMNWLMLPFPNATDFEANTIAAARVLGRSRILWFGLAVDRVGPGNDEAKGYMRDLALAGLKWAARQPVAARCHWPECAPGAGVVTGDIEQDFGNASNAALICDKEDVKGSFFLVGGQVARDYPDTVVALRENGEIGSHSATHKGYTGLPYEEQLADMVESVKVLEELGVRPPVGFRPPMEQYDVNTVKAVITTGLRFIYGNIDYDRMYPAVTRVDGVPVYQFARIVLDDYNMMTALGMKDKSQYREAYQGEIARVRHFWGLFPFSFHSNFLSVPDAVDVVRSVIRVMKEKGLWIATFGQIVDWVELKNIAEVTSTASGGVVSVRVRNGSSREVRKFPVQYFPPSDVKTVRLLATPDTGVDVVSRGDSGLVFLVDLKPAEEKEILVQ